MNVKSNRIRTMQSKSRHHPEIKIKLFLPSTIHLAIQMSNAKCPPYVYTFQYLVQVLTLAGEVMEPVGGGNLKNKAHHQQALLIYRLALLAITPPSCVQLRIQSLSFLLHFLLHDNRFSYFMDSNTLLSQLSSLSCL